jgi:GNAT superfamily N-acetyltransferase
MTRTVRTAQLEDVDEMAHVHVRSWQVTYRNVLSAAFLAALDVNSWIVRWRDRIARLQAGDAILVLEEQGRVIGFISVGEAESFEQGEVGELQAIYLDPEHTGHGLGVLLHNAGLTSLRNAGFRSALLWVGVENRPARLFYERNGWTAVGEPSMKSLAGITMAVQRYERPLL